MGFRDAVVGTEALKDAYHPGLQALPSIDRARIRCPRPRDLTGSVHVDRALANAHPEDPRWDYAIGLHRAREAERVMWVEVHPATSRGAEEVRKKHSWLAHWLKSSAPLLDSMPARFHWVASGKVAIPRNSPHLKRLAAQGIHFAGRMLHL